MSFKFPLVSAGYYTPLSYVRRTDGNSVGAQGVVYSTPNEAAGTDITYVAGDLFVVNTDGVYAISVTGNPTVGGAGYEIQIAAPPYTPLGSLTPPSRGRQNNLNAIPTTQMWIGYIPATYGVWIFNPSAISAGTNTNQVTVARVR